MFLMCSICNYAFATNVKNDYPTVAVSSFALPKVNGTNISVLDIANSASEYIIYFLCIKNKFDVVDLETINYLVQEKGDIHEQDSVFIEKLEKLKQNDVKITGVINFKDGKKLKELFGFRYIICGRINSIEVEKEHAFTSSRKIKINIKVKVMDMMKEKYVMNSNFDGFGKSRLNKNHSPQNIVWLGDIPVTHSSIGVALENATKTAVEQVSNVLFKL